MSTEFELTDAIEESARLAIKQLFTQHPGHYYYLSLITTGEAHSPVLAAWSEEALEETIKNESDKEDARWGLKWSYADSPFYCFGDEHFEPVKNLFSKRPDLRNLKGEARKGEYEIRLRAMEAAISRLDQQGLFGRGNDRLKIIVNVETMPPDYTNKDRAIRLNPIEAIKTWLAEAAEFED